MTLKEYKKLKVGDLLHYRNENVKCETIEMVIQTEGRHNSLVRVQTIAVHRSRQNLEKVGQTGYVSKGGLEFFELLKGDCND
jgi:hypothetical protein